jgi:hypothetical protein
VPDHNRAPVAFHSEVVEVTTATSTAPTEPEIREAISGPVRRALENLPEILWQALEAIDDSDMASSREPSGWDPSFFPENGRHGGEPHSGTFWADLTQGETDELREAVWGGLPEAIADVVIERVASRVAAFAEMHPDIPRGRYSAAP